MCVSSERREASEELAADRRGGQLTCDSADFKVRASSVPRVTPIMHSYVDIVMMNSECQCSK